MTVAVKKPTAAEIRQRIAQAQSRCAAAATGHAQAAFDKLADPTLDTGPALALLEQARAELASLEAALPIAVALEAAALEETRGKLEAEQRRRFERELRELVKIAMQFTAHQTNAVSAFRRACASADRARGLMPESLRRRGPAWSATLTAGWLQSACQDEVNRLGAVPQLAGGVNAPGVRPDRIEARYTNAPQNLPLLEVTLKRYVAAALGHLPAPQESEERLDLSKVAAGAGGLSREPVDAPAGIVQGEPD
jgi:hypothetical protein